MRTVIHASRIAVAAHAASLLLHLIALAQFLLADGIEFALGEYAAFFYAFLSASACLSVCALAVRARHRVRLLLLARTLVVVLNSLLFPSYLGIKLTLLLSIVVEIGVGEQHPVNMALAGAAVAMTLALQDFGAARDPIASRRFAREVMTLAAYPSCLGLAVCAMVRYRDGMLSGMEENKRLDGVVAELSKASSGYLEYADAAEQRSAAAERNRLTSELHDTVGYTLTNLIMMMEAATDLAVKDPGKTMELLEEARRQAQVGLEETRRRLRLLRAKAGGPPGGLNAIHRLVRTFQRATGVNVEVDYTNFPVSCGEELDDALYHLVQEGLTNSFRHGKATRIRLIFWRDETRITAVLRDNGRGADSITEGIGITGMRERFGSLGGTIDIRSNPQGFQLVAQVPLLE
jgi:signal transduction histidine kinase